MPTHSVWEGYCSRLLVSNWLSTSSTWSLYQLLKEVIVGIYSANSKLTSHWCQSVLLCLNSTCVSKKERSKHFSACFFGAIFAILSSRLPCPTINHLFSFTCWDFSFVCWDLLCSPVCFYQGLCMSEVQVLVSRRGIHTIVHLFNCLYMYMYIVQVHNYTCNRS